ncbi:hypothetical protein GCM10025783_09310 [Amnibacterium soli]|uniref:DUF4839 domain-containing protein n=1 Tax=Amnibacterium soli TaxID=1282736 RepID=A0ABP8YWK9_9MICO
MPIETQLNGVPTLRAVADDTVKYEFKGAVTLRGMEAPTIAKWRTEGWELIAQKPGRVRIQLMFRRPKPKSAGAHLAAAWAGLRRLHPSARAGVALTGALVLAAAVTGVALSGGGSHAGGGGGGGSVAAAEPAAAPASATAVPTLPPSSVTPVPDASGPASEKILTRKNNEDLAKLLAVGDPGDEFVADFAKQYEGRTIAFNGNVTVVSNHDDPAAGTCDDDVLAGCDFMLGAGDFHRDSAVGPNFKLDGVDSLQGLRLIGDDRPTSISAGDDVRVIAVVERYESTPQHLFLRPVSTRVR